LYCIYISIYAFDYFTKYFFLGTLRNHNNVNFQVCIKNCPTDNYSPYQDRLLGKTDAEIKKTLFPFCTSKVIHFSLLCLTFDNFNCKEVFIGVSLQSNQYIRLKFFFFKIDETRRYWGPIYNLQIPHQESGGKSMM